MFFSSLRPLVWLSAAPIRPYTSNVPHPCNLTSNNFTRLSGILWQENIDNARRKQVVAKLVHLDDWDREFSAFIVFNSAMLTKMINRSQFWTGVRSNFNIPSITTKVRYVHRYILGLYTLWCAGGQIIQMVIPSGRRLANSFIPSRGSKIALIFRSKPLPLPSVVPEI